MTTQPAGGILAVHAHPDDESITMGATLARYAAAGVPVTVVTATLGECGETMYGAFDGLDAQHADQLGGLRFSEWRAALDALGVRDGRFLGGLGAYRDSGMAGEPGATHHRAFIRAQFGGPDHGRAVAALSGVIAEVRPTVVLTYDATGGYGHPDHIAAHQVTWAAVRTTPGIRFAEVVRPRSAVVAALEQLWSTPQAPQYARPDVDELGTLVADGAYDIAVPVGDFGAARRAGMAAHATQLDVWAGEPDAFALTNLRAQPLLAHEFFRVRTGPSAPTGATDLFAM